MRLSIDSNVLFYSVDPNEPAKQAIAKDILGRSTELDMFLTNQVLGEFLNVGYRRASGSLRDLVDVAGSWATVFPISATRVDHFFYGARLAERYKLQFWDSVILAIVSEQGADIFVTEDMQDGQVIDEVELINPFAARNHDRLRDLGLITPAS